MGIYSVIYTNCICVIESYNHQTFRILTLGFRVFAVTPRGACSSESYEATTPTKY